MPNEGSSAARSFALTFLESNCKEACPIIAVQVARGIDLLTPTEPRQVCGIAISTHPTDDTVVIRSEATAAIVNSEAEKKLVVAGPGTGKTRTFEEALRGCGGRGLALTFIRNLVADLDAALGDLADVFTFHSFCKHQIHRHQVSGLQEGWGYCPPPVGPDRARSAAPRPADDHEGADRGLPAQP